PVNPGVVATLVEAGVRVLAETPPAPDEAGLRELWARVGERRMVQVAEQYLLMPGHAARRELIARGVIGRPTSVQVSSTHGYHAVSMMRGLLGVGFEPVTVSASRFQFAYDLNLDGYDTELLSFDGAVVYRNPCLGLRLMDEDIAIASLLTATAAWARDEGPQPYPLAEGCQDHLVSLAIDRAAATGMPVVTDAAPWAGAI